MPAKKVPTKAGSVFLRRPQGDDTQERLSRMKMLAKARGLTLWAYFDRLVGLHENLLSESREGSRSAKAYLDSANLSRVDA